MSALIDPAILFANEPGCPGGCCDCCDAYCPAEQDGPEIQWVGPLVRIVVDGVEYLGNRLHLVRSDILAPFPQDAGTLHIAKERFPWAVVPETMPPTCQRPSTAYNTDQVARAGLEKRGLFSGHMTHLYRDAEHVGWSTTSKPDNPAAITQDDLPLVRDIAHEAGLSLNAAAVALNTIRRWDR